MKNELQQEEEITWGSVYSTLWARWSSPRPNNTDI